MTALTVLGGSSPFVIDLIDRLPPIGPWRIKLHGRDREALAAIAIYARATLHGDGGSVAWTDDLAEALDGAEIVIHQIRYGGLDGRDSDERLAAELGVAADETLGPSGLLSAIRMAPAIARVAEALRRHCPAAWIINLTNPLACSTVLLGRAAIGLCELPVATVRAACGLLELDERDVEWDYVGLNHRGFAYALTRDGIDLMAELPARMGDRTIGGITAAEIADLGAIPLKYFRLFLDEAEPRHVGRARVVANLRARALAELRRYPTRRPPSLGGREMPWYSDAVIPLLRTFRGGGQDVHVVNVAGADGLAREIRAEIRGRFVDPLPSRQVPDRVAQWIHRFEIHERAVLTAALEPSVDRVRAALSADPMLPEDRINRAATLIMAAVEADMVEGTS